MYYIKIKIRGIFLYFCVMKKEEGYFMYILYMKMIFVKLVQNKVCNGNNLLRLFDKNYTR